MKQIYLGIITVFFLSCKPNYTAQEIVDLSIQKSGLNHIENAKISFDFRDKHYIANRNKGNYELKRITQNDTITTIDVLSNKGFERLVNNIPVELTDTDKKRFSNSINSVHYFSILPFGLNDTAVNKKLLENETIHGKEYYKVKVTFNENGGGDDFDDVFLYWFNKETFLVEFLAYKYHTNGGGIRFRDVKKEQYVKNIRLVDYTNYKPEDKPIDFYTIGKLYEEGKLKKLSEIELKNIEIHFE
ncbi:DUF6503 family protein [Tenacibaculum sp. TC6]|uniref:DUF6503 family protein n=1 Tax=Tenacibaculum sp. TC6 TaxID=3423223 RepID=UPI003D3640DA